MRRLRGEAGLSSTALAVLMPALLLWVMLSVQYGLWFHAKQVAGAAAAEAADAAKVPGGTPEAGRAAAESFLAQSGNLEEITVAVERDLDRVRVEVTGAAPQLVPGIRWAVTARVEAPTERFIPQDQR
jgi:Flp pilus assembly protein TadG